MLGWGDFVGFARDLVVAVVIVGGLYLAVNFCLTL